MESENVAALMRAYEAFERGDLDVVAQGIDPDFEIEDHSLIDATPGTKGVDALLFNVEKVREAFGDVTWAPQEVVEAGDTVAIRVRTQGTSKATQLTFEGDIGHVYTFRAGRAIKLEIFRTWPEARVAAGLED